MRGRRRRAFELEEQVVGVAPPPVLPGLVGADERVVVVLVPMRGGVAVGRIVAAADMAASHAHPQVHPPAPHLETVLAALARWRHLCDRVEMAAGLRHSAHLPSLGAGPGVPARRTSTRWEDKGLMLLAGSLARGRLPP